MGLLFQIRERWDYCAVMIVISANGVYHMLVLSSVCNLKSVRFFILYCGTITGNLAITMEHKCMCMSSHSYA